jgi:hypothetical protein
MPGSSPQRPAKDEGEISGPQYDCSTADVKKSAALKDRFSAHSKKPPDRVIANVDDLMHSRSRAEMRRWSPAFRRQFPEDSG